MDSPVVYDKGKYHDATVQESGLPEEQASVHTSFFLGWLIENDLFSEEFSSESGDLINEYRSRTKTAVDIYEWWDRCLVDDMLNEEGNAFAQAYFDFDKGSYLTDYSKLLVRDLPSEFHVPYSWENQELMSGKITERHQQWKRKRSKKPWEFWK